MRGIIIGMATLAAVAASPALAATTIVNGSFETPAVSNGSYKQYGAGGNIGGWTVFGDANNAVLQLSTAYSENPPQFPAQNGSVSLDLTGAGNTGPNGVYQDIATVLGQVYALTFYIGNATGSVGGNTQYYTLPSSISLTIGSGSATNYTNGNVTLGSVNWQPFTQVFTGGVTGLTRIAFTNTTPAADNFAGLDNVSIAAVPEPATWLMMLLGFGFVGTALRRRKVTAKFAHA